MDVGVFFAVRIADRRAVSQIEKVASSTKLREMTTLTN
jgi:hypothetical protein